MIDAFKSLDKDNDGVLSKKEIMEGLCEKLGPEEAEREAQRIFDSVDFDNSGMIDYSEFVVATLDQRKLLNEDRLRQAFELFDKDGDGELTSEELKESLSGLEGADNQTWEEMIAEADIDGDGVVTFQEFKIMMERLTQKS
jgi:calcium-dependent protein kinase